MRPCDMTATNRQPVWHKLYDINFVESTPDPKYDKGMPVRIDVAKRTFEKSYLPNYTQEIFKISKVKKGTPVSYFIEDQKGRAVVGKVLPRELCTSKAAGQTNCECVGDA